MSNLSLAAKTPLKLVVEIINGKDALKIKKVNRASLFIKSGMIKNLFTSIGVLDIKITQPKVPIEKLLIRETQNTEVNLSISFLDLK